MESQRRRTRLVSTATIALLAALAARSEAESTRVSDGLRGTVQAVYSITSRLDPSGLGYNKLVAPLQESRTYDHVGRLVEKSISIERILGPEITVYMYDSRGHLARSVTRARPMVLAEILIERTEFTTNDIGQVIQAKVLSLPGTEKLKERRVYTYDKVGHRTTAMTYDASGKLVSETRYIYDKGGNVIHRITSGSVPLNEDADIRLVYDSKGRPVAWVVHDKERTVSAGTFGYGDDDANGNWTRRTKTENFGEGEKKDLLPIETTYRKISYYGEPAESQAK